LSGFEWFHVRVQMKIGLGRGAGEGPGDGAVEVSGEALDGGSPQ